MDRVARPLTPPAAQRWPGVLARIAAGCGLGFGRLCRGPTVDVHIGRLRKALGASEDRDPIRTVQARFLKFV